jgi:hypothetical protein
MKLGRIEPDLTWTEFVGLQQHSASSGRSSEASVSWNTL